MSKILESQRREIMVARRSINGFDVAVEGNLFIHCLRVNPLQAMVCKLKGYNVEISWQRVSLQVKVQSVSNSKY